MICFIRLKSAVLACIVSWLCHISQLLIGILHFISLIFFFILVTFYLKSSLFHYNKSYLYGWFTRIALSLVTSPGISVIVVKVWDKCAHFADCLYNSTIRVCLWWQIFRPSLRKLYTVFMTIMPNKIHWIAAIKVSLRNYFWNESFLRVHLANLEG